MAPLVNFFFIGCLEIADMKIKHEILKLKKNLELQIQKKLDLEVYERDNKYQDEVLKDLEGFVLKNHWELKGIRNVWLFTRDSFFH